MKLSRIAYRRYRAIKIFFLLHPSWLGRLFFQLLKLVDKLESNREVTPEEMQAQRLWNMTYFSRYPRPLYRIETAKPVAVDSDDHKWPRGTLYDNSSNPDFNRKLYYFLSYPENMSLMDLGCSGGGLVRSVIEHGYEAVGVEGSDVSRKLRSGEWGNIPFHLFTADISENFQLKNLNGEICKFNCITAWEVLEHIPEDKLPTMIGNITRHLKDDGVFIGSVDMAPDGDPVTGANYHVTLKNQQWWLDLFKKNGLVPVDKHPFATTDYVRGHGQGLKDWDPADGEGFHVVLKKS